MIIVSDTSPIRGLLSIGKLKLLKDLFSSVIIPTAVKEEIFRIKALKIDTEALLNQDWIKVVDIKDRQKLDELIKFLDSGESEAIILAKELDCDLILMDEDKGRRIAKSLGIEVLGLIGILVLAKQKGFMTEIKPLLDKLREEFGFWISNDFYIKILNSVEEF